MEKINLKQKIVTFINLRKKTEDLLFPVIIVIYYFLDPPVGWGSTYCFTDIPVKKVSASHKLLRESLLKFFWEACFLFPRALACDFCYDLYLCCQGQSVRAFFHGMGFP